MDQQDVITFLSDGASYGKPGIAVERIDTHVSIVFLIANRAYKLKRAVSFSYLDYSTTALREQFSKAELELNRRTAPAIYLRAHAPSDVEHTAILFSMMAPSSIGCSKCAVSRRATCLTTSPTHESSALS
jgi:aminoglycoside phosphotransferase family enzyme